MAEQSKWQGTSAKAAKAEPKSEPKAEPKKPSLFQDLHGLAKRLEGETEPGKHRDIIRLALLNVLKAVTAVDDAKWSEKVQKAAEANTAERAKEQAKQDKKEAAL